jgi:hypothetical protein
MFDANTVTHGPQDDDLTQPTAFGEAPPMDRTSEVARVAAVLMTYCTPKLKYDGMTAHELATKILAVLDR